MSLLDYQLAADIIRSAPAVFGVVGPRPPALIRLAERVLEIEFPKAYRSFVAEFGATDPVYGILDESFDYKFRPDAVGRTLDLRRECNLPAQYVVIYELGDGEVFCLDTHAVSEGDCALVAFTPGLPLADQSWERVSESFGSFLLDEARQFVARNAGRKIKKCSPSDIARLDALISAAVQACLNGISTADFEASFVAVLSLLSRDPTLHDYAAGRFIAMLTGDIDDCWELITFCMHQLRWPEVRQAAQDELSSADIRAKAVLSRIVAAFDDGWEDADLYDYYRRKRGVKRS